MGEEIAAWQQVDLRVVQRNPLNFIGRLAIRARRSCLMLLRLVRV
jgi:hypothetical protein